MVVGPLLMILDHFALVGGRGAETAELTSLSSNQVFTFTSSMWILSCTNGETVQKCNAQYAEMRLLAYRSVSLGVPCIF